MPVDDIFDACEAMAAEWAAATFVLDPLAGGEYLAQRLDAELGDVRVATHSQSNTPMCRASQRLAEMISDRRLIHTGDAALTTHVLACGVRQVGEGWRLTKQPGSRAPIDAAVALAMALSVALDNAGEGMPPPKEPPGGWTFASFT